MDFDQATRILSILKKNIILSKKNKIISVGSIPRYTALLKKKLIIKNNIPKIKDIDLLIIVNNKSDLNKEITFKNKNIVNRSKNINLRKRQFTFKINNKKINFDIFLCTQSEKPYALLHFRSAKQYNIRLRRVAKLRGYKLNQYGLFTINDKKINIRAKTDLDILKYLKVTPRPYWNRLK